MLNEPYLAPDRLQNLIAAIQAMGTAGWGSRPIDEWVGELEGAEEKRRGDRDVVTEVNRKKWREIFMQHPEFFKFYKLDGEERVALRWRFAQIIDYDAKTGATLSSDELRDIPRDDKFYANYTRRPLTADQIEVLIKTAIDLHSRVIAAQQESRWRWPIIATAVTAILSMFGVILGAYLKSD